MKKCTSCGKIKGNSQFHKNQYARDGLKASCKPCRYLQSLQFKRKNPEKAAGISLNNKYRLTIKQYNKLLNKQDGVCSICGLSESAIRDGHIQKLSVDHCHKNGEIRGLLCNACNTGIARFKDNIDIMASAISYLQQCG